MTVYPDGMHVRGGGACQYNSELDPLYVTAAADRAYDEYRQLQGADN